MKFSKMVRMYFEINRYNKDYYNASIYDALNNLGFILLVRMSTECQDSLND